MEVVEGKASVVPERLQGSVHTMPRHSNNIQPSLKKQKKDAPPKQKTSKQKWTVYVNEHNIGNKKLSKEPVDNINQTDSKTYFLLTPGDLGCLSNFPEPSLKYVNTTKLFNRADVRTLAYLKAAILKVSKRPREIS